MKKKQNDNEEIFAPSNVFSEEILISNNTVFKNKVEEFLFSLNNKYIDFKFRLNIANKIWNDFKNKNIYKNVYIEPELISIKSPTTILNAPWGTGKTYFIEQIALNWNNDEIKNKRGEFENFIVIDTWKFTTFPNIIVTIIKSIYIILCDVLNINNEKEDRKKYFRKIKNVLKKIFFYSPKILGSLGEFYFPNSGLLNLGILTSDILNDINQIWNEDNEDDKDSNDNFLKELEDINKNIKPTIIVFDNIERMGIHSWEIIKAIQQLSVFDNLLFLLPINKTQLLFGNNVEYERKNESAIDKYITLGIYFNLKQDYLGILNELKFNDDDAQLINQILNVQINGYNLSIRLVERAFSNNKIKESFDINKYEGLKQIKKIWDANIIQKIIESDIKELKEDYISLSYLFNNKSKMNYNAIEHISNFLNENEDDKYLELKKETNNFVDEFNEIMDKFIDWDDNFLMYVNHNWLEEWKKFINNLKKLKDYLIIKNKEFDRNISNNNKKIARIQKNNKKINEDINKNKNKLEVLIDKKSNEGAEPNESNEQVHLEKLISTKEHDFENNQNLIDNLKEEIYELNNLKIQICLLINNDLNGSLDIFINEFESFYESYNAKWFNLENNKNKKVILDILTQEFNNLKDNNAFLYTVSNIFDYEPIIDNIVNKILL